MQGKSHQDLSENAAVDLSENAVVDLSENAAVRSEAIVEPAVWIPEFPGDEPEMEYTDWRDLLFVYSGAQAGE